MLQKGVWVFSEIENLGKHSGPHSLLLPASKNKCTSLQKGEGAVCKLNMRLFAGALTDFKAAKRYRTRTEIDSETS
jgi:hypothetical protein